MRSACATLTIKQGVARQISHLMTTYTYLFMTTGSLPFIIIVFYVLIEYYYFTRVFGGKLYLVVIDKVYKACETKYQVELRVWNF